MNILSPNTIVPANGAFPDISTKELQNMKKKVDFYVDHYSTIKKCRKDNISYQDKINFLSNLNRILEKEMELRCIA